MLDFLNQKVKRWIGIIANGFGTVFLLGLWPTTMSMSLFGPITVGVLVAIGLILTALWLYFNEV